MAYLRKQREISKAPESRKTWRKSNSRCFRESGMCKLLQSQDVSAAAADVMCKHAYAWLARHWSQISYICLVCLKPIQVDWTCIYRALNAFYILYVLSKAVGKNVLARQSTRSPAKFVCVLGCTQGFTAPALLTLWVQKLFVGEGLPHAW